MKSVPYLLCFYGSVSLLGTARRLHNRRALYRATVATSRRCWLIAVSHYRTLCAALLCSSATAAAASRLCVAVAQLGEARRRRRGSHSADGWSYADVRVSAMRERGTGCRLDADEQWRTDVGVSNRNRNNNIEGFMMVSMLIAVERTATNSRLISARRYEQDGQTDGRRVKWPTFTGSLQWMMASFKAIKVDVVCLFHVKGVQIKIYCLIVVTEADWLDVTLHAAFTGDIAVSNRSQSMPPAYCPEHR